MEKLATAIEEALYVLVPLAGEDKELRRCILAVKRNVHNGRSWPQMASDIATVGTNLTDTGQPVLARVQLEEWQGLVVKTGSGNGGGSYQLCPGTSSGQPRFEPQLKQSGVTAGSGSGKS